MIQTLKLSRSYDDETPFRRWWNTRTFIQKRLIRVCLTMLVMVICIPLYYLGFFGSVEGPLNPTQLGDTLAGMGVTKTHSLVIFLSFLIIAVTWNWIFNLVSIVIGSRLTCNKTDKEGTPCGAPVKRTKVVHKKTGSVAQLYVCSHGHKRPEAHFHPVKKGTFSHTLWVISLLFCIIVFYYMS